MKSGKKMNQVKEILAQSNRDVMMVENCGMENEKIYQTVDEIPENAGYYSLIIVKENSVKESRGQPKSGALKQATCKGNF